MVGPVDGGTSITLTGGYFDGDAGVTLGGVPASGVQFLSSTELSAVTGPHPAGMVNVAVTNSDGQSATLIGAFTYQAPVKDAGPDAGDSGGPVPDSGMSGKFSEGCSCSQSSTSSDLGLLILAMVVLTARKRRAQNRRV